jgi:hypothetical protein
MNVLRSGPAAFPSAIRALPVPQVSGFPPHDSWIASFLYATHKPASRTPARANSSDSPAFYASVPRSGSCRKTSRPLLSRAVGSPSVSSWRNRQTNAEAIQQRFRPTSEWRTQESISSLKNHSHATRANLTRWGVHFSGLASGKNGG